MAGWRFLGALAVAGWTLAACDGDSPAPDGGVAGRDAGGGIDGGGGADGSGDRVSVSDGRDAPALGAGPQLDVVFVIDNSAGMRDEQDALGQAFPAFLEALQAAPGGMPDLRIAIVSTNFGSGPATPSPECFPFGDRGRFQVRPGCGLDPVVGGAFLSVDGQGKSNFTGSLPQVFSCLAILGTSGCGYEHQLQALRGAIANPPINIENRGFVRTGARLGIVILSDEDDCSGEPDAAFYADYIPGQAGSLRCALLGHVCNGQAVPPMAGFQAPLSACAPYVRSASERTSRLINVQEFVDYVMATKSGRPDNIVVSTIIGWSDSPDAKYGIIGRTASAGGGPEVDIAPACSSVATGNAGPGVRLHAFAQSFPHHTVHSICAGDLTPAMREIGQKMAGM
jgi:hypothetical protein